MADAGYGSEENYEDLEENNLGSYVKYNKFHWEKKRKNRENPYLPENLAYDKKTDRFLCRNGNHLLHVGNQTGMQKDREAKSPAFFAPAE